MTLKPWDLAAWDAVETAERIAKKEVTALEVVEAAIARANDVSHLNAVVTPTHDLARAAAPTATGPLAGVPMFTKDLLQLKGIRTAWGTAASGTFISKKSDPTAKLLVGTGMVSLGKSSTPEHGLICTTEHIAFGPTRNPWAPDHSTGGSSGGAAALVASGAVPIAHGSDGGGSIRIPSSCCGLVGLKPTRKRLDMEGSNLLPVNIAVHGALTRTVRDTIAFWKAIDAQRPPKQRMLGDVAPKPKRLKVAVFTDPPTKRAIDPEVRAAVEQTAALMTSLGHDVQPVPCPIPETVVEDFLGLWAWVAFAQPHTGIALMGRGFAIDQHEPFTVGFGKRFTANKWGTLKNVLRLRKFTAQYAELMKQHDVWLCPTLAFPAPKIGFMDPALPFDENLDRVLSFTPFAAAINAAGGPALSLPLFRSKAGLPIGIHFAAAANQEQTLLELGLELEAARPWEQIAPRPAAVAA